MTVILALKLGPDENKTHLLFATDSRYAIEDSGTHRVHEAQKLFDIGNESSHVFVAGAGDAHLIYRLVSNARSEFSQRNYVRSGEVARYLAENLPEAPQFGIGFVVCGCESDCVEILNVRSDGQVDPHPYVTEGTGGRLIDEEIIQRGRKGLLPNSIDLAEGFFNLYDLIRYSWVDSSVDNRLQVGLMRKDGLTRMIQHHEAPFTSEEERKRYLMLNVKPDSSLRFKPAKHLADEFYERLMLRVYRMSEVDSEYNRISDALKNVKEQPYAEQSENVLSTAQRLLGLRTTKISSRAQIQKFIGTAWDSRAQAKRKLGELLSALERGGQSMRDALIKDYSSSTKETGDLWG